MNEEDFTLLNDYFNGLLAPDKAEAVEARAASDAEFGQEFALRQQMEAFPRRATQRQVFTDTITSIGTDFFEEKKSGTPRITAKVSRMRWLAAAASLALVAVAVWFVTSTGSPSYRQYARHEPPSFTERGAVDQAASAAEQSFKAGDYAAALSALDRLLAAQPESVTARLYKGICLIEIDRAAEARAVLQPMADGASALRSEAVWYIALSYLKEKNAVSCKAELLKIPVGEARYEAAQELLKKL